jgi:hypothetical protein
MNKNKKAVLLILAGFLILGVLGGGIYWQIRRSALVAENEPVVDLVDLVVKEPLRLSLQADEELGVELVLDELPEELLSGMDLILNYDLTKVKLADHQTGDYWGESIEFLFDESESGQIRIALGRAIGSEEAGGSILIRFDFEKLSGAKGEVKFELGEGAKFTQLGEKNLIDYQVKPLVLTFY